MLIKREKVLKRESIKNEELPYHLKCKSFEEFPKVWMLKCCLG
jgi:hypothetical protein